jgi:ATP/maltotriose-dependent transcriptional regulator MalT
MHAARGDADWAAAQQFDDAGTARWAINARTALDRVGLRQGDRISSHRAKGASLLVASGLSNREVATRLFVSAKTVEAHLARVYRKLAVQPRRTRAPHG